MDSAIGIDSARCVSLLKWVNTFEGIHCEAFHDLASGQVLLECLHKIMPDVVATTSKEPWKEIFLILEEFCGCSLEKAVAAEDVLSGNQEHIARVVVLLLLVAVQSKSNEKVISDIMSLDYEGQRDLMFFIETTLAKVKSHAIIAGTFTSGVGEQLPKLDSPVVLPDSPAPNVCPDPDDCVFAFPTPHRPSKVRPANFYNGLDSAAGARLLMSPAIIGCRAASRRPLLRDSSPVKALNYDGDREEISRIKHSLRVLQGTLQVEKKLAQEYYTELCTKIQEHEDLKKDYFQLERKLDCLQGMNDLQDELAHATSSLASAEKTILTYKNKIESLEEYQEKATDLEGKLATLESEIGSHDEYKISLKKLEESLLEKSNALNHAELQRKTTTIQLESKSAHLDSLLDESRDVQRKLHEVRKENMQLGSLVNELEGKISNREDAEVKAMEEKRELIREVQQMQETLDASRKEVFELTAKKLLCETSVAVFEHEKTKLHTELEDKISELTFKNFEIRSLQGTIQELSSEVAQLCSMQSTIKELETEVAQLRSNMKMQEQVTAMEIAKLEQELANKTSVLTSKELEFDVLKSTNEELGSQILQLQSSIETTKCEREASSEALESQTSQLQSIVETLNQEREAFIAAFESQKQQLCDELSSRTSELASKDLEIQLLTSAKDKLEVKVSQLEAGRKTLEQTTNSRILSLEGIKVELETQIADHHYQMKSQEQDISIMSTKVAAGELKLESLETLKEELQAQVVQLQDCYRSLEQNFTTKEAQVKSLRRELETEATEHSKTLKQAAATMETELSSREVKILSLESSKRALEEKVSQFQSSHKTLEQDLVSASARLADDDVRISSLRDLGDKLTEDVEHLQRELASIRGRNSTMESEVLLRENLLATSKEESSALQSKVLHLTELVSELQCSLQTARDQATCLATQKASVEGTRAQLEAKLEMEAQANRSHEAVLATYKSKLESSEQLIDTLKQQIPSEEQGRMVTEMTRTNQLLQSEQAKLYKRLDAFEKREEQLSSQCEELETTLAKEKTNSHQLTLALITKQVATPQPPFDDDESCSTSSHMQVEQQEEISVSIGADQGSLQCHQGNAQAKCESDMKTEGVLDDKARMKELRRRNKQALPHLKSSYPIEMQVKPVTPTNSNERLKYGSRKASSKQKLRLVVSTPSTSQEGAVATRTRSGGAREEVHSQTHTSRASTRHLSAPSTPLTPVDYRRKQPLQGQSAGSALNLREFLHESHECQVPRSTTFDVAFSPPKAALPKRLQGNRVRRKVKQDKDDAASRRETVLKKPVPGNSSRACKKRLTMKSRTQE